MQTVWKSKGNEPESCSRAAEVNNGERKQAPDKARETHTIALYVALSRPVSCLISCAHVLLVLLLVRCALTCDLSFIGVGPDPGKGFHIFA